MFSVTVSLALLVADHRNDHLNDLRASLAALAYPFFYAASLPSTLLRQAQDQLASKADLRRDKATLHRENLLLRSRLQRLAALEAENHRLRDLLGSSLRLGERVLIAELLSVDLNPYRHQLLVNKGSSSGVFEGQPVLDAKAIMGQVIRVAPRTSTVLLITDVEHLLPVQIVRNGLRAIAQGTGLLNRLELPYLPKNADVRGGDLLVSSGLGGRFPAGYPVAQVTEVREDPSKSFAVVIAEPLARLDRAHEILLAWPLLAHHRDEALAARRLSNQGATP